MVPPSIRYMYPVEQQAVVPTEGRMVRNEPFPTEGRDLKLVYYTIQLKLTVAFPSPGFILERGFTGRF